MNTQEYCIILEEQVALSQLLKMVPESNILNRIALKAAKKEIEELLMEHTMSVSIC